MCRSFLCTNMPVWDALSLGFRPDTEHWCNVIRLAKLDENTEWQEVTVHNVALTCWLRMWANKSLIRKDNPAKVHLLAALQTTASQVPQQSLASPGVSEEREAHSVKCCVFVLTLNFREKCCSYFTACINIYSYFDFALKTFSIIKVCRSYEGRKGGSQLL